MAYELASAYLIGVFRREPAVLCFKSIVPNVLKKVDISNISFVSHIRIVLGNRSHSFLARVNIASDLSVFLYVSVFAVVIEPVFKLFCLFTAYIEF